MNSAERKVFGCDDTRKKILSYIPIRCKSCHQKMAFNKNYEETAYIGGHRDYEWRGSECIKLKGYCNWCYYYVFEYR